LERDSRLLRKECGKCGTAFRNIEQVMHERFYQIRQGKTREEREDIVYHT